jgi:DNA polymerase-3 subunit gamma/tau
MSLYLKYRPDSFEAIKGNAEMLPVLENMLTNVKKCPHVFLLTGPKGCGKTTIARIIADKLQCKGSDFRELNNSDQRGIETARDIIKQSQFKAIESPCRIWLIDECHKMTSDAQNALLKIMEDTPQHIYFIFCTTDPQKLIDPFKDRCQTFQVKPLNDMQLFGLLRRIVKEEDETLEKEVFEQIIQDSLGHPRAAIQILEQVLNASAESRLTIAKKAATEQSQSIELCRALLKPGVSWKEISLILQGLTEQEPEEIRRHILGYCQSILLKGENGRAALIIETLWESLFYIGRPGLVYCLYSIVKN